jgi:DNA primase
VKVIEFPDGLDPDDYAKRFGLTGFEELMDKASPHIDYRLRNIAAGCDLGKEEGRQRYVAQSCREVLSKITSPVELDIYVKRLSRESGVSEMAIYEESGIERSAMKAAEYSAKHSRNTNASMDGPSRLLEIQPVEGKRDKACRDAESYLLLLAMTGKQYAGELPMHMDIESFDEERRELAAAVLNGSTAGVGPAELMNSFSAPGQAELARILMLNLPEDQDRDRLFADCLRKLEARKLTKRVMSLGEELKQPGLTSDERTQKLLELNSLLQKKPDIKNKR